MPTITEITIGRLDSILQNPLSQGSILVTGADWGDGGKGAVASRIRGAKVGAKDIGGHNAGHTVVSDKGEFGLGLVPSTLIVEPEALSIIGQEVVIDPEFLMNEIDSLRKKGIEINTENFMVDARSHLVMPWHRIRDALSEEARGSEAVGSLKLGVGWTYSDRVNRRGLRISDIMGDDWKERIGQELEVQLGVIADMTADVQRRRNKKSEVDTTVDTETLLQMIERFREFIRPYLGNTIKVVWDAIDENKPIEFEDSHGALLDVSHGSWPFTVGVNVCWGGVYRSFGGKAVRSINRLILPLKAYMTRVGGGPLPTQDDGDFGSHLRRQGRERGTRSGRDRRCGAFDGPAILYGFNVTGVGPDDEIVLTKLDVLTGLDEIPVCVAYEVDGQSYPITPNMDAKFLKRVKPVYVYLKGWSQDITGVKEFKDLPEEAKQYVAFIQRLVGRKISMIGTGPHQNDAILPKSEIYRLSS